MASMRTAVENGLAQVTDHFQVGSFKPHSLLGEFSFFSYAITDYI